jgi:hypothetical protein
MKEKLTIMMCALLLISPAVSAQSFAGGDGTSGNPYQIATATQLSDVRNYPTKSYILNNDIDLSSYQTSPGWFPICGTGPSFSGDFDGNGYKITGLVIDRSSTQYVGLFGYTVLGTIKNLGIEGASVKGSMDVGVLAGITNGGTVTNCYAKGTILPGTSNSHVGGLIGQATNNFSPARTSSINNCYASVSITATTGQFIGGLIGYLTATTTSGNKTNVDKCYSVGAVTRAAPYGSGFIADSYIANGGSVSVTNSYWDKDASGNTFSPFGTSKTTAEMKTQGTFSGWDFTASTGVWEIVSGYYPRLQIVQDNALPVELTSLTADVAGKNIELNWKTATETNNYGFEIERAIDNGQLTMKSWSKIGFVEGNGTTNAPKSYSFVDKSANGKTSYRLKQIDRDGKYEYSQQVEVSIAAPKAFALEQNYPNPFNPTTAIGYQLSANSFTTLKVYDAIGREVVTLINEVKEAGTYSAQFDGAKLSSGIYFAKLTSDRKTQMKKLLLLK